MKKLQFLLFTTIALLLGACSQDETIAEQPSKQGSAPQLIASVDHPPLLRSGVIENNPNYTKGEKFYWVNGDQTDVYFDQVGAPEYIKAEYTAEVSDGVQSKTCTFNADNTTITTITDGDYTVYGIFPATAWVGYQEVPLPHASIPATQTQSDRTSSHLGKYMLMKAQKDVKVSGSDPISLSYKHLASVIRFAIWNASGNTNLQLTHINVQLKPKEGAAKAVFGVAGELGDRAATSLTITGRTETIGLALDGDAQNFEDKNKDGKKQCEGYMVALPTEEGAFSPGDKLVIRLSLTDGTNNYFVNHPLDIDEEDLSFLKTVGLEQGVSYFFQLKVEKEDLIPDEKPVYAVGDYYPDPNDASTAKGIVFWLSPGSFGTKGKIVSLDQGLGMWGAYCGEVECSGIDESEDVAGIRRTDNGSQGTKNLIEERISDLENNYPAFHWIYETKNNKELEGEWYMPARNELQALYAGYDLFYKSKFNEKLTKAGGVAFVDAKYWSSSENADYDAWLVHFYDGSAYYDYKNLFIYVRAVSAF